MVWNADPILLQLGPLTVRWYGLLFASGLLIGFNFIRKFFERDKAPSSELDKLFWYIFVGTILGARLGHCLFYEPGYYFAHPAKIFAVWEGGLASHGGAIGVITGLFLFSRSSGLPFLWVTDRVAISATLAGAMIRVGNFFNSEIIGKPTSVPWAITFAKVDQIPRHATQLYEALIYFIIFGGLLWAYYKTDIAKKRGTLFGCYLATVFSARILIEFLKEPQVSFERDLPLDMGQLLSIPVVLIGLYFIFRKKKIMDIEPVGTEKVFVKPKKQR